MPVYDPLPSGRELHLGALMLSTLTADQLDVLALFGRGDSPETIRRSIFVLCATAEVAEAFDTGPFIHISAVVEPPKITSFEDHPSQQMDEIFVESTLTHVEQMLARENPHLSPAVIAETAREMVTNKDFFRPAST